MDTDDELYQRLVLDHGRNPRNRGPLPEATQRAHGDNPFCGDRWQVSLIVEGERIRAARFEGAGCAISTAAASMMSEAIEGRTRTEVGRLWHAFDRLVRGGDDGGGGGDAAPEPGVSLGDLAAFAGVRRYPVRVKCARLPWQTLLAALDGAGATVSTE
jgi:nitrogen fixation protein NifU and related proteins